MVNRKGKWRQEKRPPDFWKCHTQKKKKKGTSSHPDVLFVIDGEVGVEINHLWRSVRRSGVPCDLHANRTKKQERGKTRAKDP